MSEQPYLFYDDSPCCKAILDFIEQKGMKDKFKFYNVKDPAVLQKLPNYIAFVPTLIIKGYKDVIVGKEVLTWLKLQEVTNINTVNYLAKPPPEFIPDRSMGKENVGSYAAIEDRDDRLLSTNFAYDDEWEKMVLLNLMNKRIIDMKMTEAEQMKRLEKIKEMRNEDLKRILNKNRAFK